MTARTIRPGYIARTVRADGHSVALMFHRDAEGTRTASAECDDCTFYRSGELETGETMGDALRTVLVEHGRYAAAECDYCGRPSCPGDCPDVDGAGQCYSDADGGL